MDQMLIRKYCLSLIRRGITLFPNPVKFPIPIFLIIFSYFASYAEGQSCYGGGGGGGGGGSFSNSCEREDYDAGKCPAARGLLRHVPAEDCPTLNLYLRPKNCLSDQDCCIGSYCCLSVCEGITRCYSPFINSFTSEKDHFTGNCTCSGTTATTTTTEDPAKPAAPTEVPKHGDSPTTALVIKLKSKKPKMKGRGIIAGVPSVPKIDFVHQNGDKKGKGAAAQNFKFHGLPKEIVPKLDFQPQSGDKGKGKSADNNQFMFRGIQMEQPPKIDFQKQSGDSKKGKAAVEEPPFMFRGIKTEVIPRIDFQPQSGVKGKGIEEPFMFRGIKFEVIPRIDFQPQSGDKAKGKGVGVEEAPFMFRGIKVDPIPRIDFQNQAGVKGKAVNEDFVFHGLPKTTTTTTTTTPAIKKPMAGRGIALPHVAAATTEVIAAVAEPNTTTRPTTTLRPRGFVPIPTEPRKNFGSAPAEMGYGKKNIKSFLLGKYNLPGSRSLNENGEYVDENGEVITGDPLKLEYVHSDEESDGGGTTAAAPMPQLFTPQFYAFKANHTMNNDHGNNGSYDSLLLEALGNVTSSDLFAVEYNNNSDSAQEQSSQPPEDKNPVVVVHGNGTSTSISNSSHHHHHHHNTSRTAHPAPVIAVAMGLQSYKPVLRQVDDDTPASEEKTEAPSTSKL